MPQIAPAVPFTECFISPRLKNWSTWEFAPYCFRCNVFVDPDAPHVPVLDSQHGDRREQDQRP